MRDRSFIVYVNLLILIVFQLLDQRSSLEELRALNELQALKKGTDGK